MASVNSSIRCSGTLKIMIRLWSYLFSCLLERLTNIGNNIYTRHTLIYLYILTRFSFKPSFINTNSWIGPQIIILAFEYLEQTQLPTEPAKEKEILKNGQRKILIMYHTTSCICFSCFSLHSCKACLVLDPKYDFELFFSWSGHILG